MLIAMFLFVFIIGFLINHNLYKAYEQTFIGHEFYHGPNVSQAMVMWPTCWRQTCNNNRNTSIPPAVLSF